MIILENLKLNLLEIILKNKKKYNLKINKITSGDYNNNEIVEYKTALDVIE